MAKILIHTDGGGVKNKDGKTLQGIAYGYIIFRQDKNEGKVEVARSVTNLHGSQTRKMTSNEAEYLGICSALSCCYHTGTYSHDRITIQSDSLLAINQINGIWQARDENLRGHLRTVKELVRALRHVPGVKCAEINFVHIKRHKNKADAIIRKALL